MCPRASYMAYRCYIAIAYGYLLASILHVVFCVLCTHRFGFRFTVDLIKVVPLFINLIFESQHVMKSMNKNIRQRHFTTNVKCGYSKLERAFIHSYI